MSSRNYNNDVHYDVIYFENFSCLSYLKMFVRDDLLCGYKVWQQTLHFRYKWYYYISRYIGI